MDIGPVTAHPIAGRRSGWLGLVARLRPGVTAEQARSDVAGIWADFARRYPDDISGSIDTVSMREAMVGDTRRPLLVLIASAGLVLLIACANLAAVLLSRALQRRREFAVRAALGGGRARIVRQLLTESVLLSACGGSAGLLVAFAGLRLLRTTATRALPAYTDFTLDTGALAATAAVAMATGLLFGLAPALAAGGRSVSGALREEGRSQSEGPHTRRLRGLLMAGQVALCVSLLVGAGLLARSLYAMTIAPLGLQTGGVLTAGVQLPSSAYGTQAQRAQFQEAFLERVRAIPSVTAVAMANSLPTTAIGQSGLTVEGAAPPPGGQPFVLTPAVSDNYFTTLQIPLRQGRLFDTRDRLDTPRVAIISESLARRYWPNGNALGARMRLGANPAGPWTQVIGIVGDVRNDRTRADAAPIAYVPARLAAPASLRLLLRTDDDPLALIDPVRQVLAEMNPDLPLQRPALLDEVVGDGLASRRLPVLLMVAFGLLALLLASVGVYAMFASMTTTREREFGVRLALGSQPLQIAGLVLRQGVVWIVVGLAAGIIGIAVIARFVSGLLYSIAPFDPLTLGGSVLVVILCATLALLVPLRRATRVDPATVLRAS